MGRKKLNRIHVKRNFILVFILLIIGCAHMKLNMVENKGGKYFLAKLPFRLKIRHHYLEYTKRMHMKTSKIIHPIQKKLFDKGAEKRVLLDCKAEFEKKGGTLNKQPVSGNETRVLINIQKVKDDNIGALAQVDADIMEHLRQMAKRQKSRMLFYKEKWYFFLILGISCVLDYTTISSTVDSLLTQNMFLSTLFPIGTALFIDIVLLIAGAYAKNKKADNRRFVLLLLGVIFPILLSAESALTLAILLLASNHL